MSKKHQDCEDFDGVQAVAEMMNEMNFSDRKRLLENVSKRDPALVSKIQEKMFTFEDILRLSSSNIQRVLKEIPSEKWALAFRGIEDEKREAFFSRLPSRMAQNLQDEMEAVGPQKLSKVQEVQSQIAKIVRTFGENGVIDLTFKEKED